MMEQPDVPTMVFTQDELETIKLVLGERGFEYGLQAESTKVYALCRKLGVATSLEPSE